MNLPCSLWFDLGTPRIILLRSPTLGSEQEIFRNIWLFRSCISCVTVALPYRRRLGGRRTIHALMPPDVWSHVSSSNLSHQTLPTRPQPFSVRKLTIVMCFWTRALLCFVPNYTALIVEAHQPFIFETHPNLVSLQVDNYSTPM